MISTAQAVLQNGKYSLAVPSEGLFELTYPAVKESGERAIVKTLVENLRSHPDFEQFKQKFLDRSQRLSQCQHPNLARVIDYFEEANLPYLVMEPVEGQPLADLINPVNHPEIVSEAQAIRYIQQVGEALNALHQANLIHQDVKPENIIRRQGTEEVILTNLSLAYDLTPGIRQTHAALLSPGYASTEQYHLDKLTPKCDIYALAATLTALLTGEPPIPAPLRVSKASPSEFRTGLPTRTRRISPNVEQAILRGLELDAGRRPETVEEWLGLLPNEPIAETNSSQLLFLTPPQPLKKPSARVITTYSPSKRSPWKSLVMTGAVAASAGLGFGLAIRTHQPTEPGATIFHQDQSFPPRKDWPISDFNPSVEEGVGSRE